MKNELDMLITEVPFVPDDEPCIINEIEVHYKPIYPLRHIASIKRTEDAYEALFPFYRHLIHIQELFIVMFLNRSNKIIGIYSMSKGGITGTVADTRLILSVGLKSLATNIIISHNHPSGSLKPSMQDEHLTARIKQAAQLMDIILMDHLIVADDGKYFSFADEGLL